MRWLAPGEFLIGSPPDEPERGDNETLHRVRLSQGFWLAGTACTQAQPAAAGKSCSLLSMVYVLRRSLAGFRPIPNFVTAWGIERNPGVPRGRPGFRKLHPGYMFIPVRGD